ncbi:MAG: HTTM domain-containing protein [Planctomycetaceae bacterium]|nr:HTTM domain-containing protein [Planctomycetaceae bacterium]
MSRVFGIDTRALALFRIGIGSLLLVDLGMRLRDLEAHYTDQGVLPLEVLQQRMSDSWQWSIHALGGSATFQAALFLLAAVVAIAYLLGYQTRMAAFVSWVLLVSLHGRNPYVVNGGDVLLRLLLFWSVFLTLDRHFSIRSLRQGRTAPRVEVSLASAGILIQIGLLYWMAGYFKLQGTWLNADTLQRVLQSDSYVKPIAYAMLEYPQWLSVMGWLALRGELFLPILIFSPVWTKPIRLFAVVFFFIFHLGIELTLTVGLFSFASWMAWLLFIPKELWDRICPSERSCFSTERSGEEKAWGWKRGLANLVAGTALLFVCWANLVTVREPWANRLKSEFLQDLGDVVVLRQRWNLFPRPLTHDGWFIGVARLADGRTVDLFRGGQIADWTSYSKPKYVSQQFSNHRWRKYYRGIIFSSRHSLREPLSWYLVRQWNSSHGPEEQIQSFELHFMEEIGQDGEEEERYRQRFFSEIDVRSDAEVNEETEVASKNSRHS